jgi:outer membrane protein assembly factor BamB
VASVDAAVIDAAAADAAITGLPVWDPERHPWPMAGHDPARSGRSPFMGPITGGQSWSYVAAGASSINLQAVVSDGHVYFAGWGSARRAGAAAPPESWIKFDGSVYGLTTTDGRPRFPPFDPRPLPFCYRYPPHPRHDRDAICGQNDLLVSFYNGTIEGTPVVDPVSGLLYLGRGDGNLYAIDPQGGSVRWTFRTFNPVDPDDPDGGGEIVGGPVMGEGGALYFATFGVPWPGSAESPAYETHAVYAVDAGGHLLWRYPRSAAREDNPFLAAPALSADARTLYVATWFADGATAGKLLALDVTKPASAEDADRLRWSLPLRNPARLGNPALWVRQISVGPDGTLYLAAAQARFAGSVPAVTAVVDEGSRGRFLWTPAVVDETSPDSATLTQGLAIFDQRLYAATGGLRDQNGSDGRLLVLDARSGELLASWTPAQATPATLGGLTGPSLGADETVYVGVRGRHDLLAPPDTGQWRRGRMYALRLEGAQLRVLWSFEAAGLLDWVAPAIGNDGRLFFGSTDQFSPLLDQNTFFAPGAATPEHDPRFHAVWDGPPACPVDGTYRLTRIACGDQDITAEWQARVPETTATIVAQGDGCAATLVNRSADCVETQTFSAQPGAAAWTLTTPGITACDPDGCTFGAEDEPCLVGDRAQSYSETLVIEATSFTATRDAAGTVCERAGLPQITTWTR